MSSARPPLAAAGAVSCLGAENDFSAVATSSSQGASSAGAAATALTLTACYDCES